MAHGDSARPGIAADQLVDENGSPIELPPEKQVRNTGSAEASVGATGPANWSRIGLIALGIVVVLLLGWQMLNGGAGTDVVSGTPTVSGQPSQDVQATPAPDAPPAQ